MWLRRECGVQAGKGSPGASKRNGGEGSAASSSSSRHHPSSSSPFKQGFLWIGEPAKKREERRRRRDANVLFVCVCVCVSAAGKAIKRPHRRCPSGVCWPSSDAGHGGGARREGGCCAAAIHSCRAPYGAGRRTGKSARVSVLVRARARAAWRLLKGTAKDRSEGERVRQKSGAISYLKTHRERCFPQTRKQTTQQR